MKIRTFTAILLAGLVLFLFVGLVAEVLEEGLDIVEDTVEHRIDASRGPTRAGSTPEPTAVIPTEPVPMTPAPAATQPAPEQLTREEAEAIALEHAGFTADQVNYLRTEYEIDDRVAHYDVQFHQGRWEYEYEIHAETGQILSYDKDD